MAESIALVVNFGCQYLQFTVQAIIDEPPSKKVRTDCSAFAVLTSSAS